MWDLAWFVFVSSSSMLLLKQMKETTEVDMGWFFFLGEFIKFMLSLGYCSFRVTIQDLALLVVPGIFYFIQNSMSVDALTLMPAYLFSGLLNMRVLTGAAMSFFLLGEKYTLQELILLGIVLFSALATSVSTQYSIDIQMHGFVVVLFICVVSSFSGVLTQTFTRQKESALSANSYLNAIGSLSALLTIRSNTFTINSFNALAWTTLGAYVLLGLTVAFILFRHGIVVRQLCAVVVTVMLAIVESNKWTLHSLASLAVIMGSSMVFVIDRSEKNKKKELAESKNEIQRISPSKVIWCSILLFLACVVIVRSESHTLHSNYNHDARNTLSGSKKMHTPRVSNESCIARNELEGERFGLYIPHFDYRGTGKAMFDYATIMKAHNISVVIFASSQYQYGCGDCTTESIQRYTDEFEVIFFNDHIVRDIKQAIIQSKVKGILLIKDGNPDAAWRADVLDDLYPIPTFVLGVFEGNRHHGTVMLKISSTVSGNTLILPHHVHLPVSKSDMRHEFGIPENAIVFCRHGGHDTFQDEILKEGVKVSLHAKPNLYYIFLSTDKFVEHDRVRYLHPTSNQTKIREFINSCDAMVYGRTSGETFGLSIAEMSFCNKPIILNQKYDGFHRRVLKENAFYFKDLEGFLKIVRDFDRVQVAKQKWDFYSEEFSEQKIWKYLKHIVALSILTYDFNVNFPFSHSDQ